LGYDFVVEYKTGQDNNVAKALSRRDEEDLQDLSLSLSLSLSHTHTHTHTHIAYPTLDWLFELKRSYDQDPQVLSLTKQIQEGTSTYNRYTIKEDI
jgi:hypothetical protein